MGALPKRAERQWLMSRLTASRPSPAITEWLARQPPEVRRRHADLRLELGGQPALAVRELLSGEGWDIPVDVLTEMAVEISCAPKYSLDDCGNGYLVLDGAYVRVRGYTPNLNCPAAC